MSSLAFFFAKLSPRQYNEKIESQFCPLLAIPSITKRFYSNYYFLWSIILKFFIRQTLPDGSTLKLPPVILACLGNDPKKPTLCIYGHLDVQPANRSDGWDTEPFEMEIQGDRMFGRGTTDDKGPAISWLHVVEAFNANKLDLPVNLKVS